MASIVNNGVFFFMLSPSFRIPENQKVSVASKIENSVAFKKLKISYKKGEVM